MRPLDLAALKPGLPKITTTTGNKPGVLIELQGSRVPVWLFHRLDALALHTEFAAFTNNKTDGIHLITQHCDLMQVQHPVPSARVVDEARRDPVGTARTLHQYLVDALTPASLSVQHGTLHEFRTIIAALIALHGRDTLPVTAACPREGARFGYWPALGRLPIHPLMTHVLERHQPRGYKVLVRDGKVEFTARVITVNTSPVASAHDRAKVIPVIRAWIDRHGAALGLTPESAEALYLQSIAPASL